MKLSLFLIDLLQTGCVTVPREMHDFEKADLDASIVMLQDFYDADRLSMPNEAPGFDAEAALWAATYIFHVVQLILLRDIGEDKMQAYANDYEGGQSPGAIYSADLMLRFLPDLFRLSVGLSPNDPLIARMRITASKWPFSSVGIDKVMTTDDENIYEHPSLRYAYIDRIIQKKDLIRLKGAKEKELLYEVLGMHQATLWPELVLLNDDETI